MTQGCAAAATMEQGPTPSEAQAFVEKLNALRAAKGLNAVLVDGDLTSIAQNWASEMASDGSISHRGDLSSGVTSNWRKLGENVGSGPGVDQLMNSFTESQTHYSNMVDAELHPRRRRHVPHRRRPRVHRSRVARDQERRSGCRGSSSPGTGSGSERDDATGHDRRRRRRTRDAADHGRRPGDAGHGGGTDKRGGARRGRARHPRRR